MKKYFYHLFVLASVILFMATNIVTVNAEIEISGNITTNTTWTLDNSPYILTGTIQVLEGVTLTIEPGVTMKFNSGVGLNIGGELIASGTADNIITFTSNQLVPQAGDWYGIRFFDTAIGSNFDSNYNYIDGSIIKYVKVAYATGYGGSTAVLNGGNIPLFIDNNIIEYSKYTAININGAKSKITNNTIRNNGLDYSGGCNNAVVNLSSDNHYIENNIIDTNGDMVGIYLHDSDNSYVLNNEITNNYCGISFFGSYNEIKNNIISNNRFAGVYYYGAGFGSSVLGNVMKNNTIINNNIGIYFYKYDNTLSKLEMINNNIYNNSSYNFLLEDSIKDVDAKNNYWGTTDTGTIDSKIYDYYDSIALGKVVYEPIAVAEFDFLDLTAPILTEDTSVSTLTNINSPYYIFNSNKAGTISYSGACSSSDTTAIFGNNTIIFNTLSDGTYNNCILRVTDDIGNTSLPLSITTFTIDSTHPTAQISYSITGATNQDVIATLTGISESITGTLSHTFTENGSYTFNFQDLAGNTGSTIATVNWIDTTTPTISIISHSDNAYVTGSLLYLSGVFSDAVRIGSLYIENESINYLSSGPIVSGGGGGGGGGGSYVGSPVIGPIPIIITPPSLNGSTDYKKITYTPSGTMTGANFGKSYLSLTGGLNIIRYTGYGSSANPITGTINIFRKVVSSNPVHTFSGANSVNIEFKNDYKSEGVILYGTNSGNLNLSGATNCIDISNVGRSYQLLPPESKCTINLNGLASDTTYYYQGYGSFSGVIGEPTSIKSFKTPAIVTQTSIGVMSATGSAYLSGSTATGILFTSTGTLLLSNNEGSGNTNVALNLSGLTISSSGTWDGIFYAPVATTNTATGVESGYSFTGNVYQIGSPSVELTLSGQSATINLFVGTHLNGQTLKVYRSTNSGVSYSVLTTCLVSSGICSFSSSQFSLFTVAVSTVVVPVVVNNGGGGGGGGSMPPAILSSTGTTGSGLNTVSVNITPSDSTINTITLNSAKFKKSKIIQIKTALTQGTVVTVFRVLPKRMIKAGTTKVLKNGIIRYVAKASGVYKFIQK